MLHFGKLSYRVQYWTRGQTKEERKGDKERWGRREKETERNGGEEKGRQRDRKEKII